MIFVHAYRPGSQQVFPGYEQSNRKAHCQPKMGQKTMVIKMHKEVPMATVDNLWYAISNNLSTR